MAISTIFEQWKHSLSEWEDPFFHVNEKGDNNFQETESKTLNIHYNTRTLAWKCIWDGEIFYRVQDFSVTWQKKPFRIVSKLNLCLIHCPNCI